MLQGWLLPAFEPGVKSSGSFEARAYAGEDLKVAIARDLTPQKSAETSTGACSVDSALSAGRCSNGFHCLGSEKAQPPRSLQLWGLHPAGMQSAAYLSHLIQGRKGRTDRRNSLSPGTDLHLVPFSFSM